jgi:hypothetical protein
MRIGLSLARFRGDATSHTIHRDRCKLNSVIYPELKLPDG